MQLLLDRRSTTTFSNQQKGTKYIFSNKNSLSHKHRQVSSTIQIIFSPVHALIIKEFVQPILSYIDGRICATFHSLTNTVNEDQKITRAVCQFLHVRHHTWIPAKAYPLRKYKYPLRIAQN